jgi:tetratricopeptide (TPR) repeat protein
MTFASLFRVSLIAATLSVATALTLPAQRLGPAPKRPKIASADTNNARLYWDHAMSVFEKDPKAAAAAFYWSARIDPTSAQALYGRSVALTLSNQSLLTNMMSTGRRRDSKEQREVDSLKLRAFMIDPFLYTQLEKRMLMAWVQQMSGGVDAAQLNFEVERMLRTADVSMRAWVAYNQGVFPRALQLYAEAIKNAKEKSGFRVERGRTFALLGNADSAIVEFNLALEEMRKKDKKDIVILYNSKALLEHGIGLLLERSEKVADARDAYGKALQEDLSYYPAHLRLGLLAIDAKDTTTALSELELAAQIATDEPQMHFTYGFALLQFGRHADAVKSFNKAIELEPFYARPYEMLGEALEKSGDRAGAAAAYSKFLVYASQQDPGRDTATRKVAELSK